MNHIYRILLGTLWAVLITKLIEITKNNSLESGFNLLPYGAAISILAIVSLVALKVFCDKFFNNKASS